MSPYYARLNKSIAILVQIILQTSWIGYPSLRVVNKTHQGLTIWVFLVFLNVNDQLLADFFRAQTFSSLLYFNDDLLLLEQEIHARTTTSVAGRPFFRTDIIEV